MPKRKKPKKPKPTLNTKQALFVAEYLVDGNATQAAIRAGYSKRTAHVIGHRLLHTHPKTKAAIVKAQAKRAERTEVTADQVLRELACVGFSDINELMTWDEDHAVFIPSTKLTDDQTAAVSSIESKTTTWVDDAGTVKTEHKLKLKLWSKVPALIEMGKHLGIAEGLHVTFDDLDKLTPPQLAQRAKALIKEIGDGHSRR